MASRLVNPMLRLPAFRSQATSSSRALLLAASRSQPLSSRSYATGGVSQQPGSKSMKDLGQNALEEGKQLKQVIADGISGASGTLGKVTGGAGDPASLDAIKDQLSDATGFTSKIPAPALAAGVAGLAPYGATTLATIILARQASVASLGTDDVATEVALKLLANTELLQVQYGAIILSFLGAIHWGYEFSSFGGNHTRRYALGIAPVLAGWGSLLLMPVAPQLALAAQFSSFTALWYADQKATKLGWAPDWYSGYRFWLTAVVGGCIVTTIAAEGLYTPQKHKELGQKAATGPPAKTLETKDGMKIEKTDDAFMKITNVAKIREEERKEAEEKEKEEKKEAEKRRKDALAEGEKRRKEALSK